MRFVFFLDGFVPSSSATYLRRTLCLADDRATLIKGRYSRRHRLIRRAYVLCACICLYCCNTIRLGIIFLNKNSHGFSKNI